MLKTIEAYEFRGLREARVDGLGRLTVLVGRNAAGKSSLLEAAYVAASRYPGGAVGTVVQSRQFENGARWLLREGRAQSARVCARFDDGERIEREIFWDPALAVEPIARALQNRAAPGAYSAFRVYRRHPPIAAGSVSGFGDAEPFAVVGVATNNDFESIDVEGHAPRGVPVQLVKPQHGAPLHDGFSRAVQLGHRDRIIELVRVFLPDVRSIDVLTDRGAPWLGLTLATHTVPVPLAGDGLQAALRMLFELASPPGSLVLVEEPEIHQHPAGLSVVARVLVEAVRAGVQVIMTTHSLELFDSLLSSLDEAEVIDPGFLVVHRIRLGNGTVVATSTSAREAEAARTQIAEDLR